MGMNSPIPTDLAGECEKAAKILNKFIDPNETGNIDSVVPPDILSKAKGFAILTVIKAGFVWSGRAGSGLVVTRLPDGTWSAPSGIGTAGMGFGGQIGAQITDFLIILNTADAVKAFSEGGNVTLGGNISVAAGPLGRSAEANGTVAHFAAVYSYSKSKGLFAGVSIEGSVILERKDANAKFYGKAVRAKDLLSGRVPPPGQASVLYQALNSRAAAIPNASATFNSSSTGRKDSQYSNNSNPTSPTNSHYATPPQYSTPNSSNDNKRPPPPPIPGRAGKAETAVALYDYEGSQPSDLSFSRGDIVTIIKKTESQNDWWKGSLHGKQGDFPANYVELQ